MNMTALQARIEALWARRDQLSPATTGGVRRASSFMQSTALSSGNEMKA